MVHSDPSLAPQHPCRSQGMMPSICNPSNRDTEEAKSPRIAGQWNHWAPGSVRDSLKKKKKQGGELAKEDA